MGAQPNMPATAQGCKKENTAIRPKFHMQNHEELLFHSTRMIFSSVSSSNLGILDMSTGNSLVQNYQNTGRKASQETNTDQ
jgi:hypothetical protein